MTRFKGIFKRALVSQKRALSPVAHLLVFLTCAVLLVTRKPDVLLHAQFHSEDGKWFADAYNFGLRGTLFFPYSGYLVVFERFAGALSLIPPVSLAPITMNLIGMMAQILPVNFLLSTRCSNLGSLRIRILNALGYMILPAGYDIHVMVTNAQWHLALLACLILLAKPSNQWKWQIFDALVVLACGLTGPYCLVLLPIAVIRNWGKWRVFLDLPFGILASTFLMQSTLMLVFKAINAAYAIGGRVKYPNGASWPLFWKILGYRVFLNAITGGKTSAHWPPSDLLLSNVILGLLGVAIIAYTVLTAQLELKLFVLFSFAIFASALKSSLMSATVPQWQVLAAVSDCRYFFFPMLAFVWSLIWCATSHKGKMIRATAMIPLVALCLFLPKTWRYQLDQDMHFNQYVSQLKGVPIDTVVRIPIYPGGDWILYLKKH